MTEHTQIQGPPRISSSSWNFPHRSRRGGGYQLVLIGGCSPLAEVIGPLYHQPNITVLRLITITTIIHIYLRNSCTPPLVAFFVFLDLGIFVTIFWDRISMLLAFQWALSLDTPREWKPRLKVPSRQCFYPFYSQWGVTGYMCGSHWKVRRTKLKVGARRFSSSPIIVGKDLTRPNWKSIVAFTGSDWSALSSVDTITIMIKVTISLETIFTSAIWRPLAKVIGPVNHQLK